MLDLNPNISKCHPIFNSTFYARYKLLLLVYKSFHNQSPEYMRSCILPYAPSRPNLRSSSTRFRLTYPRTHNKAGDKTFTVSAAREWNSLPFHTQCKTSLNQFKKMLKPTCSTNDDTYICNINFMIVLSLCNYPKLAKYHL